MAGFYKYDFKELNNLPMLDVVEELNHTVKTSGRSKVMLCPFHEDHHPSMTIYDHAVKCFACDKHFGVIDFVRESEKMDLMEACNWLAEKFNVGRTWVETNGDNEKSAKIKKHNKKTYSQNLQTIIDKATNCISHPSPNQGREGASSYVFDLNYVAKHMDRPSLPQPLSPSIGRGERHPDRDDMRDCISHLPIEGEVGRGSGCKGWGGSSFVRCLLYLFDAELVRSVADMYGIGCWAVDDTMFPIIDKDLRVHNIKIQHYDSNPLSEHFFHKDKGAAWWYAKRYIETHKDVKGTLHDVNCYFGEHLISRNPSSTIVLVESPKNAVLGACVWPQFVWVAAGNKGMLNRDRLECMRGRKVIVMPDCDAVEEWREKLSTMQDIATFVISDMVEEFRKIGDKADVGDWVVKKYFKLSEVR